MSVHPLEHLIIDGVPVSVDSVAPERGGRGVTPTATTAETRGDRMLAKQAQEAHG